MKKQQQLCSLRGETHHQVLHDWKNHQSRYIKMVQHGSENNHILIILMSRIVTKFMSSQFKNKINPTLNFCTIEFVWICSTRFDGLPHVDFFLVVTHTLDTFFFLSWKWEVNEPTSSHSRENGFIMHRGFWKISHTHHNKGAIFLKWKHQKKNLMRSSSLFPHHEMVSQYFASKKIP